MGWRFNKDVPIYCQIMEIIKIRIANGTYNKGDRIPSVRNLALEAGVNPNTVQRALYFLEREEIIVTDRTNGRFVTSNTNDLSLLRENLSNYYIDELFDKLRKLKLTKEEIEALVKKKAKDLK